MAAHEYQISLAVSEVVGEDLNMRHRHYCRRLPPLVAVFLLAAISGCGSTIEEPTGSDLDLSMMLSYPGATAGERRESPSECEGTDMMCSSRTAYGVSQEYSLASPVPMSTVLRWYFKKVDRGGVRHCVRDSRSVKCNSFGPEDFDQLTLLLFPQFDYPFSFDRAVRLADHTVYAYTISVRTESEIGDRDRNDVRYLHNYWYAPADATDYEVTKQRCKVDSKSTNWQYPELRFSFNITNRTREPRVFRIMGYYLPSDGSFSYYWGERIQLYTRLLEPGATQHLSHERRSRVYPSQGAVLPVVLAPPKCVIDAVDLNGGPPGFDLWARKK